MSFTPIRLRLELTPDQAKTGLRMVMAGQAMWRLGLVKRLSDRHCGRLEEACGTTRAALLEEISSYKRIRPWMADIPDESFVLVLKAVEKAFRDHRDHGRGLPDPAKPQAMCFFPTVHGFQIDLDAGQGQVPFLGTVSLAVVNSCSGVMPKGRLSRAKIHRAYGAWFLTMTFLQADEAFYPEVA